VVAISLPASLEFSESPAISLERCLIFMKANAQITTNKMPPTIPPAIAPMFGDEALGVGSAPDELDGSIVAASPTANVEKWVTGNKHTHCPFWTVAVHGDNGSGTAEGLFAVASETA
jgi:hypothetical protein